MWQNAVDALPARSNSRSRSSAASSPRLPWSRSRAHPGFRRSSSPPTERLYRRGGPAPPRWAACTSTPRSAPVDPVSPRRPGVCISRRFVIFSMTQVALSSLFLNIFTWPVFGEARSEPSSSAALSAISRLRPAPQTGRHRSHCRSPITRARPSGAIFAFNCLIRSSSAGYSVGTTPHYSIVFQSHRLRRSTTIATRRRDAANHDALGGRGHDRLRQPLPRHQLRRGRRRIHLRQDVPASHRRIDL